MNPMLAVLFVSTTKIKVDYIVFYGMNQTICIISKIEAESKEIYNLNIDS